MRVTRFTTVLSLLLGMLLTSAASAAEQRLVILSASDAPAYSRAAARLSQRLQLQGQTTSNSYVLSREQINPELHQALTHAQHIVAIGSKACDYAAKHSTSSAVSCGFITSNSFEAIREQVPGRSNLTALYIDQPLQRLLNLASLIGHGQEPYRVGLLSSNTQSNRSVIADSEANNSDLEIRSVELQLEDNPVKVIEPLIFNSDVLIVQPSAKLFNRLVAKLILQLSLRYKVPVIGFSQKYSEAGALVSLYASPEDIGEDLAEYLIHSTEEKQKSHTLRHGRHFSVSVNSNVARKLQSMIDADALEQQLKTMESNTDAALRSR